MIFEVQSIDGGHKGKIKVGNQVFDCALGKKGVLAAAEKREGDNKTPAGKWAFRKIFYRKDKIPLLVAPLEPVALEENFGWCDAADDVNYNKFVLHPYPKSAEHLWRKDDVYDIIVILGHNDDPVVPGYGSAIFMHVARPDYSGTEGCVALKKEDLITLLALAAKDADDDFIEVVA